MAVETKQKHTYTFAHYLNARSATSPAFSPDGQSIAFISDITGIPQLWEVPVEGGWPDQLTFTDERIASLLCGHREPRIVFGMDSGGNEREQLFLLQDGQMSELAVDPEVMHMLGAISPDDGSLAYSDNRRHPAWFDVYLRDLRGSAGRPVFQNDGSNFVRDWSPDGARLLIERRTGALDTELALVDLASGASTELTPHTPPVTYTQGAFTPNGKALYFLTDQDSEYSRAARMDLASREIEFLTPDDNEVEWLALSDDGTRLALVYNLDGYSRLVVRDLEGGREWEASDLPRGVIMQPAWSRDSRLLAFVLTAPSHNPNIWVWNLAEGPCKQVTRVACGGITQESFVQPELVRFPSCDGLDVPALFYLPEADNPPVVVHVHGGPEGQARPIFNPTIQYFVHRGYAVLAPNVRGSTGYGRTYTHLDDVEKRMDSVADLKAAADWLAGSGRVDSSRMAVMGASYGGFMVLAALTSYPEIWAAGIDIVGLANFETFFKNTGAYRRHWRTPEYGDPERHQELFRQISPIHQAHKIRAPLLVVHGDNDPRVPLNESEQIVETVRGHGYPVEFIRFQDEGHGVVKLKNKLVAYPAIGAFLDRHLSG